MFYHSVFLLFLFLSQQLCPLPAFMLLCRPIRRRDGESGSGLTDCNETTWFPVPLSDICSPIRKLFRGRGWIPSLPQPGGEAAHVLRHPAVVHHRQLRPPHLLQVGRAGPPAVQVGAPFVGPPPGLNAGVRRVALRGETREERESTRRFIINVCRVFGDMASVLWCPVIQVQLL